MVSRIGALESPSPDVSSTTLPSASVLFGPLVGLSTAEKQQLEAIATGLNPLSRGARKALAPIISKPEFRLLAAEVRLSKVRTVFNKSVAEVVSVYADELLKGQRGKATHIGAAQRVPEYDLNLRTMAKMKATLTEITVAGVAVKVYAPASGKFLSARGATALQNHTIDQVARALSMVTVTDLRRIKEVRLSPVPNPDDHGWAEAYHSRDFVTYMNASADGVVTIFPWVPSDAPFRMKEMASTMMHELGHVSTNGRWGRGTGAGRTIEWTDWAQAGKDDVLDASLYARSSVEEDAGETDELRKLAFYAPQYISEFRALFPRRFKILDTKFPLQ